MRLRHDEEIQIIQASAMLLVEAIEDAGPRELHGAAAKLKEEGEDYANKATKRAVYKELAKLVKREAKK